MLRYDPVSGLRTGLKTGLVGIVGSASRFLTVLIADALVRMEWRVALGHAIVASLTGMIFGGLGALMVPPIIRRLEAHGLLLREGESEG